MERLERGELGQRIVVVGSAGSGKTTLALKLAARLALPHIEMDGLYWEANWQPATADTFRVRVAAATEGARWVVDGNYSGVRDLLWGRADTLIWLDYERHIVMWRVFKRTLRRTLLRERLWNGNRERIQYVLTRDGLLWWAWSTYARRRRETPLLLQQPDYTHLAVRHFQTPTQAERWLDALA